MAKQLTDKQAKYVEHRLAGKSQAESAKLAGYQGKPENMDKIGSQVEANPKVAAAIQAGRQEINKHLRVDAERVLLEASRLATFDARKMFNADGSPKSIQDLDDDTAACISGIKIVTKGNSELGYAEITEYKVSDKNPALEKLFKHFGLYEKDNAQRGLLADLPRDVVKAIAEKLRDAT